MNYDGYVLPIPLGSMGLRTDDPDSRLQIGNLVRSMNLTYQDGRLEKARGSRRWNTTALGTGILGGIDYWPTENDQRIFVCGANGQVYRFTNFYTRSAVPATGAAPTSLNVNQFANFLVGGSEEFGNDRKLFLFTGYSPVQVVEADGTTRRNIANGAPEWAGNDHPIAGIIHRNRLFCWRRYTHDVQVSSSLDHEDFLSDPIPLSIYPGEGDRIADAFVYSGKLFFVKFPVGLYVLVDDDPDPSNWFVNKVVSPLGAQNPRSHIAVFQDIFIANQFGGISSLQATDKTGDVQSADLFGLLRCQNFVEEEMDPEGYGVRQALYYPAKKQGLFVYRSKSGTSPDRLCTLDFSVPESPKVFWGDKDQARCLFLVKDSRRVERPFYGAPDGYLYQMDQADRWVGTDTTDVRTEYLAEAITPAFDCNFFQDPRISERDKFFDHLELVYNPTGRFKVYVDYFIDGVFRDTVEFDVGGHADLGFFKLNRDRFDQKAELSKVKPMKGSGKKVSFRVYNQGVGENFKIVALRAYFRIGGMTQGATNKGA